MKAIKEEKSVLSADLIKQAVAEVLREKEIATKKDVESVVVDVVNTVIIPGMDNIAENIKSDLGMKISYFDRKFNSQQNRLDKHNDRIEKLEKIHPQGKHLAIV